jgi:hypothetical protein
MGLEAACCPHLALDRFLGMGSRTASSFPREKGTGEDIRATLPVTSANGFKMLLPFHFTRRPSGVRVALCLLLQHGFAMPSVAGRDTALQPPRFALDYQEFPAERMLTESSLPIQRDSAAMGKRRECR